MVDERVEDRDTLGRTEPLLSRPSDELQFKKSFDVTKAAVTEKMHVSRAPSPLNVNFLLETLYTQSTVVLFVPFSVKKYGPTCGGYTAMGLLSDLVIEGRR